MIPLLSPAPLPIEEKPAEPEKYTALYICQKCQTRQLVSFWVGTFAPKQVVKPFLICGCDTLEKVG